MSPKPTVLLTDYAWADTEIERRIVEAAGFSFVSASARNAEEVVSLAQQCEPSAILTCWAPITADAIEGSTKLQHVGRMGIGLDNIDVDACTRRGVWVTNVPDYCVDEVSDHAIAFLLAWTRGLIPLDRQVRGGHWNPAAVSLKRLSTLTVGLIGYGAIGQLTAKKLQSFGCRIVAHTHRVREQADNIVEFLGLEELLGMSHAVILHIPLTEATRHLMNADRLGQMRPGSLLVNVSRGPIIDTEALIVALHNGHIDAALDVIENEPMVPNALTGHSTSIFTPHVAFSSDTSVAELRLRAANEAVRILQGKKPEHPCNRPTRPPA
jgi:D-3-phosphoglycerate dehydrogenase / 2-oxoglutarate reductase